MQNPNTGQGKLTNPSDIKNKGKNPLKGKSGNNLWIKTRRKMRYNILREIR